MYVQYKPGRYIKITEDINYFYYAIPGYNLVLCDDHKNPISVARYIGHFEDASALKEYKIKEYQTFLFRNDFWTAFEDYKEDYEIVRNLRAGVVDDTQENTYKKQYPQVFVFDKTIADFICSSFSLHETNIPIEILDMVPFYNFRIKTGELEVCFKYELGNLLIQSVDDEDLRVAISVGETSDVYLNTLIEDFIKEQTKSFNAIYTEIYGFSDEKAFELSEKKRQEYTSFINKIIPLVLYVSSVNAEIKISPQHMPEEIYKKEYPEEQIKYVGVDTAYSLKQAIRTAQTQSYDITSDHKMRKPHMRKAHFHHYWVNDTQSRKKKLILKWLAPILVNAYTDEEKERYVK